MTVAAILAIINGLLGIAFQLYSSIAKVEGTTPIPTWDELANQNALLQIKINGELKPE